VEKSFIVLGAMEATLTPLMERIEHEHPGVKVFSLPSVDHPEYGKHIDLGVKGQASLVEPAFEALKQGLNSMNVTIHTKLVR
jgi:molybdopterin-biosynthesis enzyme MoeA-like protein